MSFPRSRTHVYSQEVVITAAAAAGRGGGRLDFEAGAAPALEGRLDPEARGPVYRSLSPQEFIVRAWPFFYQLDAPLWRRKEALLFRDSWGERTKFTSKSR